MGKERPIVGSTPKTFEDLASSILRAQVKIMLQRRSEALSESDPEHLHQIRVALRRSRHCLRLFRGHRPAVATELDHLLKTLDSAFGPARDADVVLRLFQKLAKKLQLDGAAQDELDHITGPWFLTRQRKAVKAMKSESFDHLSQVLGSLNMEPCAEGEGLSSSKVNEILDRQANKVERSIEKFDKRSASPERLHDLRIKLRRYRYALEFFAPFTKMKLGSKIKRITKFQELLGLHHDLTLALDVFTTSGLETKEFTPLGTDLGKRLKKTERAVLDLVRDWKS